MLVMKFGGAAVAAPEKFSAIAELVLQRSAIHEQIIVVVSAMGKMTDELIALAHKVNPYPPHREQDMLISVGERISIALLAMALSLKGCKAVSFTGSQSGIITCERHTEARIIAVRPKRLIASLQEGKVVIVAGFQGVSETGEITTLGRGGSDTSAVALGIALGAERVEFYKDVPGIFSADPKSDPTASLFPRLTYKEALAIAEKGAKVLHPRCIALAARNGLPLKVLPFSNLAAEGTCIEEEELVRPLTPVYEEKG